MGYVHSYGILSFIQKHSRRKMNIDTQKPYTQRRNMTGGYWIKPTMNTKDNEARRKLSLATTTFLDKSHNLENLRDRYICFLSLKTNN